MEMRDERRERSRSGGEWRLDFLEVIFGERGAGGMR